MESRHFLVSGKNPPPDKIQYSIESIRFLGPTHDGPGRALVIDVFELLSASAEPIRWIGTWTDTNMPLENTSDGSASFSELFQAGQLPESDSASADLSDSVRPTGGGAPRRAAKAPNETEDSSDFQEPGIVCLVASPALLLSHWAFDQPNSVSLDSNLDQPVPDRADSIQPGTGAQANSIFTEPTLPVANPINPFPREPTSVEPQSYGITLENGTSVELSSQLEVPDGDSHDDTEVHPNSPDAAASSVSRNVSATNHVPERSLGALEGASQPARSNSLPPASTPNDMGFASTSRAEPETPGHLPQTKTNRISLPNHNETTTAPFGRNRPIRDSASSRTSGPAKRLDSSQVIQHELGGHEAQDRSDGSACVPNRRSTAVNQTVSVELRSRPDCSQRGVGSGEIVFNLVFDPSARAESESTGATGPEVDTRSAAMPDPLIEPDLEAGRRSESPEQAIRNSRVSELKPPPDIRTLHESPEPRTDYGPGVTDQALPVVLPMTERGGEEPARGQAVEEQIGSIWSRMDSLSIDGDAPTRFEASPPLTSIQVVAPGQERVSVRVLEASNGLEVRVSTEDREARQDLINGIDELINKVRELSTIDGASRTQSGDDLAGGRRQQRTHDEGQRPRPRKPALVFSAPTITTGAPPAPTRLSPVS